MSSRRVLSGRSLEGGLAGRINYILNPNAHKNVAGWVAYADAAGSAPVDGTGGSPTLTITRSTTSPLRGDGSYLITTTAANLQGQGASYDFTIDTADQAKILAGEFDLASDVTQATGDWVVGVYDVTNAVMIQPAGYQIQGSVSGTYYKHIFTFQTASNSTSYRLCIHRAVTTATAVNLKIDNVIVGPQVVQYGAPVTDWQSWTPTGGWSGANVTYAGRYRRVGDSMEVQVHISLTGAPTGSSLLINLPSGHSIDTTKLSSTAGEKIYGLARIFDTGTKGYDGVVAYASTTSVAVFSAVGTSPPDYALVTATNPFTFGSGDGVNIIFSVPIQGWSSTVQMSNDTDTRVVDFIGANSASTSLATSGTYIPFTSLKDSHGSWSTDTYTVPVSGDYEVTVGLHGSSASNYFYAQVDVDGTLVRRILQNESRGDRLACGTVGLVNLRAGQTIKIKGFSDTSAQTLNSSAELNYLFIRRISGPSAIAASETVAASAYRNGSQTGVNPNNSAVKIQINSKSPSVGHGYDTHGAFDTTTNYRYTIPVSGKYRINGCLEVASTNTLANNYQAVIYLDGSPSAYGAFTKEGAVTQTFARSVTTTLNLVAGQYVELFLFGAGNNSASTLTVNGGAVSTYLEIERIGN